MRKSSAAVVCTPCYHSVCVCVITTKKITARWPTNREIDLCEKKNIFSRRPHFWNHYRFRKRDARLFFFFFSFVRSPVSIAAADVHFSSRALRTYSCVCVCLFFRSLLCVVRAHRAPENLPLVADTIASRRHRPVVVVDICVRLEHRPTPVAVRLAKFAVPLQSPGLLLSV